MNFQLKRIRKERGLRQEDLAKAIFSTPRIVGAWERGETPISLEDACALADYFNITLDELAGREWSPSKYSDPRQQSINAHYETFNDDARQDVYKMVERMSHDPHARIEKEGPGDVRAQEAMGA